MESNPNKRRFERRAFDVMEHDTGAEYLQKVINQCGEILVDCGFDPDWPPEEGENVLATVTKRIDRENLLLPEQSAAAVYAARSILHLKVAISLADDPKIERAIYNSVVGVEQAWIAWMRHNDIEREMFIGRQQRTSGRQRPNANNKAYSNKYKKDLLKKYDECVNKFGKRNAIRQLAAIVHKRRPASITQKECGRIRKQVHNWKKD